MRPASDFEYDDYLCAVLIEDGSIVGFRLEDECGDIISEGLEGFKNVKYFSWSYEEFDGEVLKVPAAIGGFKKLERLWVMNDSDEFTIKLPDIEPPPRLRDLWLRGSYENIPDWISELPALKLLTWEVESLEMPDSFSKLPKSCPNKPMAITPVLGRWAQLHPE